MSMKDEISFRIGGKNGDGIFSAGDIFSKICSRSGLNVHAYRSYQSVIRGGHVNYSVRGSNQECRAPADEIDVLIAVRPDSFLVDAHMVSSNGIILYDSKGFRIKERDIKIKEGIKGIDFPASKLAAEFSPLKMVANTVFIGAVVYILKLPLSVFEKILTDQFSRKGESVVKVNVEAARAGFNWAKENIEPREYAMEYFEAMNPKMFVGGNETLAIGMINGGLQFYAWYPMTPASSIGGYLTKYGPKAGVIVKQMEDEINVSNATIGASFSGARAACGTSGGGFALMTEAIGFSAMAELPAVFVEVARTGPSTGLPTKTEQGDLNQLLGASQGDFPRAIIAQTSIQDGFYLGTEVLNIAAKYQIPVLVASDLYLGEHFETIDDFDWERIPIDDGKTLRKNLSEADLPYLRYALTEDGISPRTIPGVKYGQHDATSDEHDENAKLVSDVRAGYPEAIEVRLQQMKKRMEKIGDLLKELPAPQVEGHSAENSDILLVGWGSTLDTIRDARRRLEEQGLRTSQLQIKYVVPFHAKEVSEILNTFQDLKKTIIMIEVNYSAQMARHIRSETGFEIKKKILKYDGESLLPSEIIQGVRDNN